MADEARSATEAFLKSGPVPQAWRDEAQAKADDWWDNRLNDLQREFLNCRAREAMITGGNRCGKSVLLQLQACWYVTGVYPKNYSGLRMEGATPILCCGETQATTRDTFQEPLVGIVERDSTKRIAATGMDSNGGNSFIDPRWLFFGTHSLRTSGLVHRVYVRHADGGASQIFFGSYAERQRARKGYTFKAIFIDESAGGMAGYQELFGRLVITLGPTRIGWCPVAISEGEVELYNYFNDSPDRKDRVLIRYPITSVTHLGRAAIEAQIRAITGTAEEQPRLWGNLAIIGGKTFYEIEKAFTPRARAEAGDFSREIIGVDLPHTTGCFGAVHVVWNEAGDLVMPVAEYQEDGKLGKLAKDHAAAVKVMGGEVVSVAWPHDGERTTSGVGKTGDSIADIYRGEGLRMMPYSAAYENLDGSKSRSIRRAIQDIRNRLIKGTLLLCEELTPQLIEQLRGHRVDKKGKPVKGLDNHLVDALIKALMCLPYATSLRADGLQLLPRVRFSLYPAREEKRIAARNFGCDDGDFFGSGSGGLVRTGFSGRPLNGGFGGKRIR